MNIYDYFDWRKDLSFEASPFNEVDNLIISQMAYVSFDNYIEQNKKYTIFELSKIFFSHVTEDEIKRDKSFTADSAFTLKRMAESVRFKDAILHDFVSKTNKETSEQFCAMCLDLADGTTYIAFRGTDDTLIGWREDFLLSYTKILAQDEALNYLLNHIEEGKKYRVGGHSKGGNLAEYASIWLPQNKQEQIINIYSNDGPGNKSDFLPDNYQEIYERLKNKLVKYVPDVDIFGAIYSNKYKPIVIKSDGVAFSKHSGLNWNVLGTSFVRTKESKDSKLVAKAFKEFLNDVSEEKKKILVDEIFGALDEAGLNNISDIAYGGIPVIIKTIKKFSEMNEESKETAAKLINTFVNQYKQNFANEANVIKNNIIKTVQNATNDAKGVLNEMNIFSIKKKDK